MKNKKLLIPIVIGIAVIGVALAVLGKFNLFIWGLILLCPLMHLFGHNHSGHDHSKHNHSEKKKHYH